jgi:hypothetical protein
MLVDESGELDGNFATIITPGGDNFRIPQITTSGFA